MTEDRILPLLPELPNPPRKPEELVSWAVSMTLAIQNLFLILGNRIEETILQGLDANKPTADGRRKLYFATDTNKLYYDDGAWHYVTLT